MVLAGVESELFDLERHLVPKALALHTVALAVLLVRLRSWRRIEPTLVDALLLGFAGWSLLSALFATNRWLALNASAITGSGVIVYLGARAIAGTAETRRAQIGLALAAGLAAALGLAQAYGADWSFLAASRAPGGTFGNRNFLAHVLAISLPALLLIAARARGAAGSAAAIAGVALVAATILLTRSRAAWLASVVALLVMAIAAAIGRRTLSGALRGPRVAVTIAAAAAGIAAAIVLPNRLTWRSDSPYAETFTRLAAYDEGSGRGRLIQYGNSLELVRRAPLLGVGPGNWFVHYPRVTEPGDPSYAGAELIPTNPWPSSDWIAFISERGPIGALLLLAGGLAAAIAAVRRLRSDPETAAKSVALLGTLVATVVTGAFDAVLLLAAPTLFAFAFLGLWMPAGRPVLVREPPRGARIVIGVAAAAFVACALVANAGRLAAIVMTANDPSRSAMERAVRFDPGNHRLRLLLARRGGCSSRAEHAIAAYRLMPHHDATRNALEACGLDPGP